ncbi:MAG: hypothetical protein RLZZ330_411 [Actinomycetota bacterium]
MLVVPADSLASARKAVEENWLHWQDRDGQSQVRTEVEESWQRSAASVSVEVDAAPSRDGFDVDAEWNNHALNQPVTLIEPELRQIAEDGGFIVAITDATSTILWTTGSNQMKDRAGKANFAPGAMWDELSVGTNALDLSLRTEKAQTVFSAEHFAPLVHQWVCYSAPLLDPRTSEVVGVLDLSTTWENAHPLAMRTTVAMASLIQHELGRIPLPSHLETVQVNLLGKTSAHRGNSKLNLSKRQLEICALLALHPNGLSFEEMQVGLYGDKQVSNSTLKSEISHLRSILNGMIESRPYRFNQDLNCDVLNVLNAIKLGNFSAAMHVYAGPLLPTSNSPLISDFRNWLDIAMRQCAMCSLDVDAISAYLDLHPYELEVAEYLSSITLESDSRYPYVRAKLLHARSI